MSCYLDMFTLSVYLYYYFSFEYELVLAKEWLGINGLVGKPYPAMPPTPPCPLSELYLIIYMDYFRYHLGKWN